MANLGREKRHGFGVAIFEERKHPRLLLNLPIEYYPEDSKTGRTGHTGNASEGGMIIYLRNHFEVGQLMKLKLFFAAGPSLNNIEMVSRVVWTEELEDAEYRCGMEFIEISQENMIKLNSFLKALSC